MMSLVARTFPELNLSYLQTDSIMVTVAIATDFQKINYVAKPQITGPLIYIPLNNNSIHCYILRSTKDSDTCK